MADDEETSSEPEVEPVTATNPAVPLTPPATRQRWLDRRSITVAAVSVVLLGGAFALGWAVGDHGSHDRSSDRHMGSGMHGRFGGSAGGGHGFGMQRNQGGWGARGDGYGGRGRIMRPGMPGAHPHNTAPTPELPTEPETHSDGTPSADSSANH